jgi:DNA-binding CsgD family transcriptional regulator
MALREYPRFVGRGETLSTSDYRGILRVLETCEGAGSLSELLEAAAASVCQELGFPSAALVLTTSMEEGPPRAHRIELFGESFSMDEYFERWVHLDTFHSPEAIASLRATGTAQISELAPRMEGSRRRYVEEYLVSKRHQNQTTVWLPTGRGADGFLTPINNPDDPFNRRDRGVLLALRPHLSYLLRILLPGPTTPACTGLRAREAEIVDLIALGYSNRVIADTLGIAENTVKKHVSRALATTGCSNRTQLASLIERPTPDGGARPT